MGNQHVDENDQSADQRLPLRRNNCHVQVDVENIIAPGHTPVIADSSNWTHCEFCETAPVSVAGRSHKHDKPIDLRLVVSVVEYPTRSLRYIAAVQCLYISATIDAVRSAMRASLVSSEQNFIDLSLLLRHQFTELTLPSSSFLVVEGLTLGRHRRRHEIFSPHSAIISVLLDNERRS